MGLADYLFHQGTNFKSYEYLGASLKKKKNSYEYTFRVWAPNASKVGLIGDFISWSEPKEMTRVTEGGVYECVFESAVSLEGQAYKYLIQSEKGRVAKGDPYARRSRGFDDGASVINLEDGFRFTDKEWMKRRRKLFTRGGKSYLSLPLNIYEMHLGSFLRHPDGSYYTYSELSVILPLYLKSMGYTHVELMPLTEHPFDGSWGYQVGAFFAPTCRYGTPGDLKKLINSLHNHGIGVIIDWVPAHFPKDEWGLYEFDGSPLYEYQGKDRQESHSWGTRFFDLGREEIQSFLISSALYFLREFHVDGLRVDAVASMIYLDYDRADGEWIPNSEGTNENKEAVSFLRKLNAAITSEIPDALMIAEESAAHGGITKPLHLGGLGFSLKWNMGFANDLYDYLATDPLFRKYKHKALTFPLMYAFDENYVLPISHDEVVHGKRAFADKSFGEFDDKLRTARLALLLIMTYPGKKMLFMGTEYAQFREWTHESELEWFMLDYPKHRAFRDYVMSLNHFYLKNPPLYESDFSEEGFEWISPDECDYSSVVFKRISASGKSLTVALNFSGAEYSFTLPSSEQGEAYSLFDTGNFPEDGRVFPFEKSEGGFSARVTLPPHSGIILGKRSNKITV